VDEGRLPLLSPEVHHQLLCVVDIEGEVIEPVRERFMSQ
jgi:hypothetical protein